jgi:Flp pilus assembly protein TadD
MNFRLTPFAFVVMAMAFCAPVKGRAQQPKKSSTTPPRNPQKVSNPLNDTLDAAQAAIEKKDFPAAVAALKKFLAEKPDIAYVHFQLAYAYAGLEQWDDAKSEYQRAIALDPKMAEAYLNLGLLLVDRKPAEAVAPLRAAVDLLPAQSRPRFLLGWALERSGDLEGALEPYQAAERLDPQDYEATFALGRALLRLKRAPDAEKEFRKAIGLRGDSAPARLGLANALFVQDKPEAAEAFTSYLELQPQDRESRRQLARSRLERHEFKKALAELDLADAGAPPGLDSQAARRYPYWTGELGRGHRCAADGVATDSPRRCAARRAGKNSPAEARLPFGRKRITHCLGTGRTVDGRVARPRRRVLSGGGLPRCAAGLGFARQAGNSCGGFLVCARDLLR